MFPGERWASPGYVVGSGEMVTKTGGIVRFPGGVVQFHLDPALIHHHVLSVGHDLGPSRLCDLLNILNLINDRRKARFQNTQTDRRTDMHAPHSAVSYFSWAVPHFHSSTEKDQFRALGCPLSAPTALVFSLLVGCQNPTTARKLNFSLRQQVTFGSSVRYSE